jgi:hypothetical protein
MRRFPTVAILALAALVGCGGSDEDSYKLVKVTGTITKNGRPLGDAKVSFLPDAGNKDSTPGIDQSGAQGSYMLMFKGRTGIAAGKYKVIITPAVELPAGVTVPAGFEKQPGMFQMARDAKNRLSKQPATAASKKDVVKSEFEAEVESDVASKTLDFDVKSL